MSEVEKFCLFAGAIVLVFGGVYWLALWMDQKEKIAQQSRELEEMRQELAERCENDRQAPSGSPVDPP